MQTLDAQSPSRWLVATWCAIVAVLVMAALTGYVTYRWADSRNKMELSSELVTQARAVQSDLLDMETGQRGFLLSGSEDYLTPFNTAKQRLSRDIATIIANPVVTVEQTQKLATLARLAAYKSAELDSTIVMSRSGKQSDAVALVRTNRGKATMDTARDVVSQIQAHERAVTAQLTSTEVAWGRWLWLVLSVGTALTVGVLLVLRGSLLNYAREQRQAIHELNRQMVAIEEQERMVQTQSGRGARGAEPK